MDDVGFTLILLYLFLALAVVMPLYAIPLGVVLSYERSLGISVVPIYYVYGFTALIAALLVMGFILYRYRYPILKPLIRYAMMPCPGRGLALLFSCGGFAALTLVLLVLLVIVYLINTGVLAIPGYNYIPGITRFTGLRGLDALSWVLGLVNSVLSALVVVGVVYHRFKSLGNNLASRLGGAFSGVLGVATSLGSAVTAATACSVGACTISASGLSPLMVVITYVVGFAGSVDITRYALVLELALLVALGVVAYYLHRGLSGW